MKKNKKIDKEDIFLLIITGIITSIIGSMTIEFIIKTLFL